MFMRLLQNEWLKSWRKRQFVYFTGIMSIIIVAAAVLMKVYLKSVDSGSAFAAMIQGGLIDTVAFYFAVTIAATTVTQEYRDGTMKQLLIRSASRLQVLAAKYVMTVMIVILTIVSLLIVTLLASLLVSNDAFNGEFLQSLFLKASLAFPSTLFYLSLSFFISIIVRNTSISLTVAILLSTVTPLITLIEKPWAQFLPFRHLNLAIYSSDPIVKGVSFLEPFAGFTMATSALLVAAYIAVFLAGAALIFQKRDVQ